LLLRAAVSEQDSVAAWLDWRKVNQVEVLEGETADLAALIYRNLEGQPGGAAERISETDLSRLRGVFKFHWSKHQLARKSLASALGCLSAAGVACALHRETALAFAGPYSAGTRPLRHLDLLIKGEDLAKADAALRPMGWSALRSLPSADLMPFLPGLLYRHPNANPIFLVWHPIGLAAKADPGGTIWQRLRQQRVEGHSVLSPDPDDLLLMVCVQAARSGASGPGPLASADLIRLVNAKDDPIDWSCLQQRSAAASLKAELSRALGLLRDEAEALGLEITVPADMLSAPTPSPAPSQVPPSSLTDHWALYKGVRRAQMQRPSFRGFAAYLIAAHRWYWQVPSLWRMPGILLLHCLAHLAPTKSYHHRH
jgi:hypothetical protein